MYLYDIEGELWQNIFMKFQKELALKIIENHLYKDIKIEPLGKKAISAIKTMKTNLEKKGYEDITKKYFDKDITLNCISRFEETIKNTVESFYNKRSTISTEDPFHTIQLWGGGEGRYIYVKGGGFKKNFNSKSYIELINSSFNSTSVGNLLNEIIKFNNLNKFINVAFITKHTRFLTLQNKQFPGLPIYDSVMSKNLMLEKYANIKHLEEYWENMIEISNTKKIQLDVLERILFNYFR